MTNETTSPAQKEKSQGSVLLIDDDKFLVDMYGMKFTNAGFLVHTCLSVSEALQALRGGLSPDAVVFDLVMPEQDGFSFLETLRAEKMVPGAVAMALTNQSSDAEKKRLAELGVDRFIVKASMIPSEVVEAVKEEISKKKSGNPNAKIPMSNKAQSSNDKQL